MIQQIKDTWAIILSFWKSINFQFIVEDIDQLLSRLKNSNYPIFELPNDSCHRVDNQLTGNREFLVLDTDGYLLRFTQHLGFKTIKE
jgi:hypothetical protein